MRHLIFSMLLVVSLQSAAQTDAPAGESKLPEGHPSVGGQLRHPDIGDAAENVLLPNEGRVVSVIQSSGYTYIEAATGDRNIWLAVSRTEVKADDLIRFGKGMTMTKFYSNTLKREFPEILFVERVKLVE